MLKEFLESENLSDEETLELRIEAVEALRQAKKMYEPEFTVRSNIEFDPERVELKNFPLPSCVLFIEPGKYLQIKSRFNSDWWLGTEVKHTGRTGFIPSPSYLQSLLTGKSSIEEENLENVETPALEIRRNSSSPAALARRCPGTPAEVNVADTTIAVNKIQDNDKHSCASPIIAQSTSKGPAFNRVSTFPTTPTTMKARMKKLLRKESLIAPYEIVPTMRPIIFVGPSLKGFPVTDEMQRALIKLVKTKFENRLIVARVNSDFSKIPNKLSNFNEKKFNSLDKRKNPLCTEIEEDVDKVFELSNKMKLLVLECNFINHPSQIINTCIAPLIICIKIQRYEVLTRLIKSQGKSKRKPSLYIPEPHKLMKSGDKVSWLTWKERFIKGFHSVILSEPEEEEVKVQITAAASLIECNGENCDLILTQSNLPAAFRSVELFLENYWTVTHQISPSDATSHPDEKPTDWAQASSFYFKRIGIKAGFSRSEISNLLCPVIGWTSIDCGTTSPVLVKKVTSYSARQKLLLISTSSGSSGSKNKDKHIPIWKKKAVPTRYKDSVENEHSITNGRPGDDLMVDINLKDTSYIATDSLKVYASRSNIEQRQIQANNKAKQDHEHKINEVIKMRRNQYRYAGRLNLLIEDSQG